LIGSIELLGLFTVGGTSLRGQGPEADLINVILNSIQGPLVNKYDINSGSRDNNHELIG
jgi:hypothetical protein